MNKKTAWILVLVLLLVSVTVAFASSPTYTEVWDGRGTDSLDCTGYAPGESGIHWVFSTKGASTSAVLTLGGTGSGTYTPAEPLNAAVWHFNTPYFELDGLTATIELFGGNRGRGGGLVISDYCPGVNDGFEELMVSKTAETAFTRTHDWKIAKVVKPSLLNLYVDGTYEGFGPGNFYMSGTGPAKVVWGVTVGYLGFGDSGYTVSGLITVVNTGTLDAVITDITDTLAGNVIGVNCDVGFPYTLPAGHTLNCSYSEAVSGQISGFNEVTVTTERDVYAAEPVALVWGDPAFEHNASVQVTDSNDTGGVLPATLHASDFTMPPPVDTETFNYSSFFSWSDYGADQCGTHSYTNIATLTGDAGFERHAEATLTVIVECP